MVGPVSRGRTEWLGLIFAALLSARVATATEAQVTVSCSELSAEDTAQVEARVRASLLSAGLTPATVELSCELDGAQTQVTGNGHQVLQRSDRADSSVKEALLASADNALAAWGAPPSSAAPPVPPTSATPSGVVPVLSPVTPPEPAPARIPDAGPGVVRSSPASTWLSAGLRAELWSSGSGLGPQLGLQQKLGAAFFAFHAGYLLSLPSSTQFSAHDLQFGAHIGWQPQPLFGLRGALGVGLSIFGASRRQAGVPRARRRHDGRDVRQRHTSGCQ